MALRFAPDVATAETEYGTVLLDQRKGRYWELNPTGTLVVRTLLDGGGEADAVEALVGAFAVDRRRAAADVAALVALLRDAGLAA
ncbi:MULTISPECIES: lasso peptide biosynthesis PqqD family chaperone [Streptomyces]|uniref:lasso peptide biosynthesis PqqD family chaperone n=1 Tax=Streptomyces TaxID=1883 RepID=UPI00163D2FD7|nr:MULTISPECIES: lasso peptide biosynthesis PqqD family chaperone [Streptomyces]MBC2878760.1 lasso peptide biosynthesis PqqD family chaperone [Streptomyces sp. TYQ1024]UBI39319.1 lasso peptide biosynthesis PqqD family chaperone [Streptomyces mobaraensis]UKW31899.1 lasso peptide biosynthesis PqqD family chaperone [Streptomyces sp. TYQ1024]